MQSCLRRDSCHWSKVRLQEEGHEGDGLENLTQQILDAAAQRLVFLVGLESDQVGL